MIRCVREEDLDALCALEAQAFPPEEAAGRDAFRYRIRTFSERFFVLERDGRLIGLINGCLSDLNAIDDSLYGAEGHNPAGRNQMIFGLAVERAYRHCGVASSLMRYMIDFCCSERERGIVREKVILTCKRPLIPFYTRFGFVCGGVSRSCHGGAQWFDMTLSL